MNRSPDNAAEVTLAHFSDIHVTCLPLGWRRADWFNKRLVAWLNLRVLGRAFRFRRADEVLAALVADLRAVAPDHVIFSGDATALGFDSELAHAARLLGLKNGDDRAGLAVPGNHDYCTLQAQASGDFERHFAAWQAGERVDGGVYPFAQRVGSIWLVAVNSSTANRWAWDASGGVDGPQLERLGRLLERLSPGPRIMVTHYPLCLATGKRERRSHGLRNLNELVATATQGGVCLWLHGHRHGSYHHQATDLAPFPVICAGSATQHGLWSYMRYTVGNGRLDATRRTFDPSQGAFREAASFELPLPGVS
jgi:3',5'-cyclic AMP phosphodiesterase CpdA